MSNDEPPNGSKYPDLAVAVMQRESGERGRVIVHRALESAREELIAALGHAGAAHMLRQLADRIESEI